MATLETYRRTFQAREQRRRDEHETLRQRVLTRVREQIPPILAQYPSVERAYLFGSMTRPGDFTPHSDIDLALDGVSAREDAALWHVLNDAFPDNLIDVRALPTSLSPIADFIRHYGILIYEREDIAASS